MRVFWALIAVLVLVAAGVPIVQSVIGRSSKAGLEKELARTREIAAREQRAIQADVKAGLDQTDPQSEAPTSNESAATTDAPEAAATPPANVTDVGKRDIPEPPLDAAPATNAVPAAPEPLPSNPPPESAADTTAPDPAATGDDASKKTAEPQPPPTPTSAPGPAPTSPTNEPAAQAADTPKIVKKDDGSTLVDDRFVMKGEGTPEKPYEITWELLVSANETYDPRVGRKKLPGRVMMLDGKHVRITGYIAYPLFVEQPRECLMMLNQWDGCCIGVPPTPYDAVEVRLKSAASQEMKMATYAIVEGKLGVKPYLAGDWLVGLYILEQGTLTAKQFNGMEQ
jgi:hypothetical protein